VLLHLLLLGAGRGGALHWTYGCTGHLHTNPSPPLSLRHDTHQDELRLVVNGAVAHTGRRQAAAAREASSS
jgi:hypothetical protein